MHKVSFSLQIYEVVRLRCLRQGLKSRAFQAKDRKAAAARGVACEALGSSSEAETISISFDLQGNACKQLRTVAAHVAVDVYTACIAVLRTHARLFQDLFVLAFWLLLALTACKTPCRAQSHGEGACWGAGGVVASD